MSDINLSVDSFGTVDDPITKKSEEVKRFTWTNGNGMSVQVNIFYNLLCEVPNFMAPIFR
jgi:hypothetical protein